MTASVVVRPAKIADAAGMAQVIVTSWRETYRGLMPDEVLDDPGMLDARTLFWTSALTDARWAANRVAVAERDGDTVGVAMSGEPLEENATEARQLFVLYVLAEHHGTGAGPALLDAVLDRDASAMLWVADPNPRAQAFYRRSGFSADGVTKVERGIRHVRMTRPAL